MAVDPGWDAINGLASSSTLLADPMYYSRPLQLLLMGLVHLFGAGELRERG